MLLRPQAPIPDVHSPPTPIYLMATGSRTPKASAKFTSEGWFVTQPTLNEVHPAFRSTPPSPDVENPAASYLAPRMKEENRRDSGIGRNSVSTVGSIGGLSGKPNISLNAILEMPNTSTPPPQSPSTGRRIFMPVEKLRSLSLDEVPRWKRRSSTSGSSTRSQEKEKEKDKDKEKERAPSSHRGSIFSSFSPFRSPPPDRPLPPLPREANVKGDQGLASSCAKFNAHELFRRETAVDAEDTSPISPGHAELFPGPDDEFYMEPDDEDEDIFVYPKTNKYDYPITVNPPEYDTTAFGNGTPPLPPTSAEHQNKNRPSPHIQRMLPNSSIPGSLTSLQSTTPSAFKAHPGQRVAPGEMRSLSLWSSSNSSHVSEQQQEQQEEGERLQPVSSKTNALRRKTSTGPRPKLLSMRKSGNALLAAAKTGDHAEVMRLVGPGSQLSVIAATDKDGMTALHLAAMEGHTDVARLLIHQKAPLEARSKSRERTPVYFAAENGHSEIVQMLIEAGADFEATGKYDGASALHKACQNGHLEVIVKLIKAGADVNRRDIEGMTPMMWAVQGEKVGSAKLLLAHGANLEVRIRRGKNLELASKEGLTVLYKVVERKNRHAFVRIFLEAGADSNADGPNGMRPLHRAASLGDPTNVGMLIEYKADLNRESNDGWTPLHCAARYGQHRIYSMLVRAGADESRRNSEGQTPRELARIHGNEVEFV